MKKNHLVCWLYPLFALGMIAAGPVSAQHPVARAQTPLEEVIGELDGDRDTWVRAYKPGVFLLHGHEEDKLAYFLEHNLYNPLPRILVFTTGGRISVTTCQELFSIRGALRISVDRGSISWSHYRSCDEKAAQVRLAPTQALRFEPLDTMRELITTVPIRSFNLPSQVLDHFKRFPVESTILTVWPDADDGGPDAGKMPGRYANRSFGSLLFQWGSITFAILGFGDFDGDGIQDVLFGMDIYEDFPRRGLCTSNSLLYISRPEPGGPLVPHQIAHVHRQCEGRGFNRRQP